MSLDAILANALPPARSKALLAQLIEEVRVVSGQDVRVTYRVPPEVRLPDGMVEMRGLEPLTLRCERSALPTELTTSRGAFRCPRGPPPGDRDSSPEILPDVHPWTAKRLPWQLGGTALAQVSAAEHGISPTELLSWRG